MDPTVVRRNDFFDRRAELRRSRKIVAWITIAHGVLLPVALIWQGGLLGLGIVLLLAVIVVPWTGLEDAWSKRRMRRRLQAAAMGDVADGRQRKIDAWLLVNGSLGVGLHAASNSLYLFTAKGRAERFDVRELRRLHAQRKRRWLGWWQEALFISDMLAGPGLELPVIEGDLQSFLRLASRESPRQGRGAATLAARA
jgi:hypothetical protein